MRKKCGLFSMHNISANCNQTQNARVLAHGRVWHIQNKHLPENCWVVRYPPEPDFPDGYEEDWDHGDMLRYGIDFIHGRACTSANTWPHKARKPAMSVRARVSSPPRLEDVAANAAVDSADNPMSNSGNPDGTFKRARNAAPAAASLTLCPVSHITQTRAIATYWYTWALVLGWGDILDASQKRGWESIANAHYGAGRTPSVSTCVGNS
eukprot:COSAG02_NODE_6272_length_3689_cov_3.250418_2_plen_209_part_00